MAPSSSNTSNYSRTSLLIGSATSGGLELVFFHPVDTIAKRVMSNTSIPLLQRGLPWDHRVQNLTRVVFGPSALTSSYTQRYFSLFPGFGFAAGYKILQRVYKFGGQPMMKGYLTTQYGPLFQRTFGKKSASTWIEATAGMLMGIGEIVLLPLDVLKIKSQTKQFTSPSSMSSTTTSTSTSMWKYVRELYRGAGWTAARNAPGSFALFGGNQFSKTYVFGLEGSTSPTFLQLSVSSMMGSMLSILVSAPLDVIKTRLQNQPFHATPVSGYTVIKNLIRHEGMGAFFKGLVPKLSIVGPKLVFSFTVAQWLIEKLHRTID